jgi:hypothetical protein
VCVSTAENSESIIQYVTWDWGQEEKERSKFKLKHVLALATVGSFID